MLRAIYVLFLRLHPRRFRREFSEEMLWIFDQTRGTVEARSYLADVVRSLVIQWIFRSDLSDEPALAGMTGPPSDRVPVFYTSGSEIPPPAALANGLLGSLIVFGLASFAMMHSGGPSRLLTYSSNDFHEGAPGHGGDNAAAPSKRRTKTGPPAEPASGTATGSLTKMNGPAPQSPSPEPESVLVPQFFASVPPPPPGADFARPRTAGPPASELPDPHAMVLKKISDPKEFFRRSPVLDALDADHDGRIAPEEIINAPKLLAAVDKNHDGQLDAVECGWNSPLRTTDQLVQSLMSFDRNQDGKLQRQEMPRFMLQPFDRADVARHGVLTGDEIRNLALATAPTPPDEKIVKRSRITFMRTNPVLWALDLNHDGQISASEIRNAEASLKTLDRDADGWLRLDEVVPGPVDFEVAWFFRLDEDFDGRISREESQKPLGQPAQGLLEAADRNGDGFVTWDELAYEIRMRADVDHDGLVTWQEMAEVRKSGALFASGPEKKAWAIPGKTSRPGIGQHPIPKPVDLR
jgi:Ca2+-binding EF-hand superfamily protein